MIKMGNKQGALSKGQEEKGNKPPKKTKRGVKKRKESPRVVETNEAENNSLALAVLNQNRIEDENISVEMEDNENGSDDDSTISSSYQDSLDGFIVFTDREDHCESDFDYFSESDFSLGENEGSDSDSENESDLESGDEWLDLNESGKEVSVTLTQPNFPFKHKKISKKTQEERT
eukprot:TRINITY_DN5996_c0_g1_i2.p1 TRINITY_DN5996_c0_g1~~TRINITY_DN5996_c0_g1_i2.p1  ORF type:complete len:175 (-),score=58.55 TRINITY_DN5996_c0_g1_i2:554-1078(-)